MNRKINLIVLHCSDSDIPAHDSVEVIREWHLQRGFSDIGYHYVITKDGMVHKGRHDSEIGAHVKGHNANSIGICLAGRHEFTAKQFTSLGHLCQKLCYDFGLGKTDILGHTELDPHKTCPNYPHREIIAAWDWH